MLPTGLTKLLNLLSKLSEADVLRNIISASILCPIDQMMSCASRKPALITGCSGSKLQPTKSTASRHSVVYSVPNDPLDTDFISEQSSSDAIGNEAGGRVFDFLLPQQPTNTIKFDSSSATFLDFFMHILVQCEFPTSLATFMLELFPDMTYKVRYCSLSSFSVFRLLS